MIKIIVYSYPKLKEIIIHSYNPSNFSNLTIIPAGTYPNYGYKTTDISVCDLTDQLIEINLTRRIEYDDASQIAFGDCDLVLSANSVVKELVEDYSKVKIFEITFNNKLYFLGILAVSYGYDVYNNTYTIHLEDILDNFLSYLGEVPLINWENYGSAYPIGYADYLEAELKRYFQNNSARINFRKDNINLIRAKFRFDNPHYYSIINTNIHENTNYYWLAILSYASFFKNNIGFYTAQDFLKILFKTNGFTLFYNMDKKIWLRDKYHLTIDKTLNDYEVLEEDMEYQYDYKNRYQGIILNGWTRIRNIDVEDWFLTGYEWSKTFFILEQDLDAKNYLDLRYDWYGNMKQGFNDNIPRGLTKQAAVLNAPEFVGVSHLGRSPYDKFYEKTVNNETLLSVYYRRILNPYTHLLKLETTNMEIVPGLHILFNNQRYLVLEVKYDFENEKAELLLRSMQND